ncbi:DDE superfamily endonuclease [Popillia japonica]|uniref:DDE superfamily endonuclease n=1 Tax=Popillia japonica TaxID=7064 RepID=A0AAW1IDF2_POPJA
MASLQQQIFLLANITSSLSPMDQSVSETMKRHYRRQVLTKLSVEDEDEEECSDVSTEDAEEWMVCDLSDPGFQILSDDEPIESMIEGGVEEEDELEVQVEADTGVLTSAAFACLDTTLN